MSEFTVIRGKSSRSADWSFTVVQGDLQVAAGSGQRAAVEQEALHYGRIYASDAPGTIVTIKPPRGFRP